MSVKCEEGFAISENELLSSFQGRKWTGSELTAKLNSSVLLKCSIPFIKIFLSFLDEAWKRRGVGTLTYFRESSYSFLSSFGWLALAILLYIWSIYDSKPTCKSDVSSHAASKLLLPSSFGCGKTREGEDQSKVVLSQACPTEHCFFQDFPSNSLRSDQVPRLSFNMCRYLDLMPCDAIILQQSLFKAERG